MKYIVDWILIGLNLACAVWLWPSPIAGLNCFAAGWLLGNFAPEVLIDQRVREKVKR